VNKCLHTVASVGFLFTFNFVLFAVFMMTTLRSVYSNICAVQQVGQRSPLFQMAMSGGSRASVHSLAVKVSFLVPFLNEDCKVRKTQYCGAFT